MLLWPRECWLMKLFDKETEEYSDQELLRLHKNGSREAADLLLNRYKGLVRAKARSFYLVGQDNEDLIQEGMIGLFDAVRDYDPDKGAAFTTFADLCISRQLYTAVQAGLRKKHAPLNEAVSLEDLSEQGAEENVGAAVPQSPEQLLIGIENAQILQDGIRQRLSRFENIVLEGLLNGEDYRTIAVQTGKSPKSIDNAIQRIRKKIREYLREQGN